jgi:hypothetical protein
LRALDQTDSNRDSSREGNIKREIDIGTWVEDPIVLSDDNEVDKVESSDSKLVEWDHLFAKPPTVTVLTTSTASKASR